MLSALQHRLDRLPIHSIIYYHSYHQAVLQILLDAIKNPAIIRHYRTQYCLGMTPLHILACSSVHNLELYRVIVENYPANLITEDRWGALPLLYAFWGAAPSEIIQFLLDSYQLLYPGYEFNCTNMVKTMGRCDTPKEYIQNLFCVKQTHFPEQPINWDQLLDKFAMPSHFSCDELFTERMQLIYICGMSEHI